jgi:L-ribulose-5-phosphate 3-epimerase
MIKATSMRCFPQEMNWRECIKEARVSGYEGVEVNFDGRFDLDCSENDLKELKNVADGNGIKIVSVYSRQQWKTPISSGEKKKREEGIRTLERLIEIAEYLEAPTILTIPGAVDNSILSADREIVTYEDAYKRVKDTIAGLAPRAKSAGVILALENVPNKFLLSPLEFRGMIEEVGSDAVGCHFDTANCLYYQGVPEDWIRILGKYIKAIHLKDYKTSVGTLNGFCDIFEGDTNWKEVCMAIAETGYDGSIISEVLPVFRNHPEVLWKNASISIDRIIKDIQEFR